MRIELLKNSFKPDGSKTPDILKRGSVVELPDDLAKKMIEKGVAAEVLATDQEPKHHKPKKEKAPKPEVEQ